MSCGQSLAANGRRLIIASRKKDVGLIDNDNLRQAIRK